jgi:hypothetical protein
MGSFLSAQTKPAIPKPAAPLSVYSLSLSIRSLNLMHFPPFPSLSPSVSLCVVDSVSARRQSSVWAASGPGGVTIGFQSFGF